MSEDDYDELMSEVSQAYHRLKRLRNTLFPEQAYPGNKDPERFLQISEVRNNVNHVETILGDLGAKGVSRETEILAKGVIENANIVASLLESPTIKTGSAD